MKATFGAGCFWGVEASFMKVKGVKSTTVGYMGGKTKNPTYEEVCTDRTGHAEVVQIEYNPDIVSYEELLDIFWNIHDPTQKNRQGPDIGNQYRSVIFYHNEKQKDIANDYITKLEKSNKYDDKIETLIEPADIFWRAEEYHQKYFEKNPNKACHL